MRFKVHAGTNKLTVCDSSIKHRGQVFHVLTGTSVYVVQRLWNHEHLSGNQNELLIINVALCCQTGVPTFFFCSFLAPERISKVTQ